VIEELIATFVSYILSLIGVATVTEGPIIHVPALDRSFIVVWSCIDLPGVCLQTLIFAFILQTYASIRGLLLRPRIRGLLIFIAFIAFFLANCLRMALQIYLVTTIYEGFHLISWQAFEEQVGIGVSFTAFLILLAAMTSFLRRQGAGQKIV